MDHPLISVVIPVTRYETELPEALSSVFSQTYQNFEIVLVDNHATEGSRRVAEEWRRKFPDRIRIFEEENRGACSARNRGIIESQGEFVALLDSDDRMKPERLEKQLALIRDEKSVALVGAWFDEIDPDGHGVIGRDNKPGIPRWSQILFSGAPRWRSDPFFEPLTSTFFFRTSDAKKIGMFDRRFDPIWQEDTDFSFRLYEVGKVKIVPQALVDYRVHTPTDGIRRIFDLGVIVNHDVLFSKLREKYYQRNSRDSKNRFEKLKSRWLRESGIKLLYYRGGDRLGKELIWKSFKLNPSDPKNWETIMRINLPTSFYPRAFGIRGSIDADLPGFATLNWAQGLFALD